jgi:hypothetical protein
LSQAPTGTLLCMGSITGYSSLPALDYAVSKAGLLKLMPAFAEEAAPLDKTQGAQACDPPFSQQGKLMPPQLRGSVCINCRAAPSNPRRLCRAVPSVKVDFAPCRAGPSQAMPCRAEQTVSCFLNVCCSQVGVALAVFPSRMIPRGTYRYCRFSLG